MSRVRLPNWVSKPSLFTLTTSQTRCMCVMQTAARASLPTGLRYLQSQKLVETAASHA